MSALPIHQEARRRLREAQSAEADALHAVTRALAARARVQTRVDAADANIAVAIAHLASGSGVARAAQLLGQDVSVVRRMVRAADDPSGSEQSSSASAE